MKNPVRRENIFQPTIMNGRIGLLPEIDDNDIKLVNFVTSKNLIRKKAKCSRRNIQYF